MPNCQIMRDMDTFNRTSILENAKNMHKVAYCRVPS